MKSTLKIHERDRVAVALRDLERGETLEEGLKVRERVKAGHKVALTKILPQEEVVKYGHPMGRATRTIDPGEWVHTHNMETNLKGKIEYSYEEKEKEEIVVLEEIPTFLGYKREDGQIGIRNEIWIIPTVGCINKVGERIARLAEERFQEEIEAGLLDGIFSFSHPYGCSQLGEDLKSTQRILANLVEHPNAAGVLVLGLGCENNLLKDFRELIPESERIHSLNLQEKEDEIRESLEILSLLVREVKTIEQEEVPLSSLRLGLKCGGSDSFSGITANPLVGRVSDYIVGCGGSSILTEVPEMFGAETILMERAESEEVFLDIVSMINGFKDYFSAHDQEIYENPSPGNKEGGITTLEEKSLGCIEKGGHSLVRGVTKYGERVKGPGLHLLEGPGNDMVSITAMAAAGAHMILFTTGRGTPLGGPIPTIKVSTNSHLYHRKRDWMDFNAGLLLEGHSLEDLEREFLGFLLEVASKKRRTCQEIHGYREIAIFKRGVTL